MTDREKVIKRLEECLSASCRGFRTCPYSDNEWDAVRAALALLREQEPPGWISVKDRLPQSYEYVIVAIDDDSGDSHFRYTERGWYFQEGKFWIVGDERRTDVYAWRPFPEPPEEASGDA